MQHLLGWEPIMDGPNIIGLADVTGGGAISLEPGGQFELSGAPLETVHQTAGELIAHLAQLREVARPLGIGFLGLGMTPNWSRADIPQMPKGRYKIMTAYMPKVGRYGLDMMYRTCTVQTNLDFSSESDMVKKLRVGLALQPVATALFANSPFTDGKPNGFISFRAQIWLDTDKDRTGMLPFVLAMAPFVSMRAFEQIRDDCAYNRNNVKLLAPFAGLEAGPWGATHHAIEDIALLRSIPGMTVLSPADPNESLRAVRAAAEIEGPVYIRLGFLSPLDGYEAEFRVGEAVTIREGRDLTLVATGGCVGTVLAVREALRADGISARVLNVHTLKPLDRAAIERAARETGRLLTVEEHSILGGLGGAVAEVLAELGTGRLARVGLRDVFATEVAPYPELLRLHGLDAAGVEAAARALLGLG